MPSRKDFIAMADALYESRPGRYGAVVSAACADGMAVAWSQWRDTRYRIGVALRRANSRFDWSRFDYWSEHGESEPTSRKLDAARKRGDEHAPDWHDART